MKNPVIIIYCALYLVGVVTGWYCRKVFGRRIDRVGNLVSKI